MQANLYLPKAYQWLPRETWGRGGAKGETTKGNENRMEVMDMFGGDGYVRIHICQSLNCIL